jgi:hypothetical protein
MKLVQSTLLLTVLAIVVCASLAFSQRPNITVPIKVVYAGTDSLAATNGFIYIGNDTLATFCAGDTAIFHEGAPPTPIGGIFDSRFVDPRGISDSCFDQGTYADYRPWLTTVHIDTFKMALQVGATTGTYFLSWPSGLSAHYQVLQMIDAFGGFLVNVDMLTNTVKANINSAVSTLYIYGTPIPLIPGAVKLIDDKIPHQYALSQNYPNPFNPSTKITFAVQKAVEAQIVVYDVLGRRVKTLASEHMTPGTYTTEWNGVDEHGNTVGSGVYFVRMVANDASTGQAAFSAVRKLMLAK